MNKKGNQKPCYLFIAPPKEVIEYLGSFPKIESVLFGASSKGHIQETKELIETSL